MTDLDRLEIIRQRLGGVRPGHRALRMNRKPSRGDARVRAGPAGASSALPRPGAPRSSTPRGADHRCSRAT
jgi:hypothetical protein